MEVASEKHLKNAKLHKQIEIFQSIEKVLFILLSGRILHLFMLNPKEETFISMTDGKRLQFPKTKFSTIVMPCFVQHQIKRQNHH